MTRETTIKVPMALVLGFFLCGCGGEDFECSLRAPPGVWFTFFEVQSGTYGALPGRHHQELGFDCPSAVTLSPDRCAATVVSKCEVENWDAKEVWSIEALQLSPVLIQGIAELVRAPKFGHCESDYTFVNVPASEVDL